MSSLTFWVKIIMDNCLWLANHCQISIGILCLRLTLSYDEANKKIFFFYNKHTLTTTWTLVIIYRKLYFIIFCYYYLKIIITKVPFILKFTVSIMPFVTCRPAPFLIARAVLNKKWLQLFSGQCGPWQP